MAPPAGLRNPFPPLEILRPEQVEQIHQASLRILEEVGLNFQDPETLDLWRRAGARVDFSAQRVWLDRGLVMALLARAPCAFTWRGRNPARSGVVGGDAVAFGPCGGMAYVTDLERGRRAGTQADYEDFVRLAHLSPHLHFAAWEQVTAQDVPVSLRHLHRLRAAIRLSDKPLLEAAHGREITADNLALARLVFGADLGAGPAGAEPVIVIGDVINASSPLRFDQRMLGGLLHYARAGQACFITPFILAGAMSPITPAAALAQQNAEALAGAALTQLARPGAPVLLGGFTTNADMRSGSPAFGTPEGAWALLAGAQLARFYRLPYRASGALTTANLPDAQAAWESLWTLWPAVLGGSHLIMHACGWLEGGLTASFEKFVLDLEDLARFADFLRAPEVEVGRAPSPGRGADEDALRRAKRIWREQLREYEPPALDPAVAEAIDDYIARRERELRGRNLYE